MENVQQEYTATSFHELHDILGQYRENSLWCFRGHGDSEWRLVPKAGREQYLESDDETAFRAWQRRAPEFLDVPLTSDWDWLALAQHYGLATRLLDWSYNPLVAAYFAVEDNRGSPAIYALYSEERVLTEKTEPFAYTHVGVVRPRAIVRRVGGQAGRFTIHSPPTSSLADSLRENWKLERIIIDPGWAEELRVELDFYGINRLTLFPDLDGLSTHANWLSERRRGAAVEELDSEEIT